MPLLKLKRDFWGNLSNFQQNGLGCDCFLKCPSGELKAHRNILSSGSEWFKNNFEFIKHDPSQTVYFQSLTLSQLKAAVDIIYGRKVILTSDDATAMKFLKFSRIAIAENKIKKDENTNRGRPRKHPRLLPLGQHKRRTKTTEEVFVEAENSPNTPKDSSLKTNCRICNTMVKCDLLVGHIERVHGKLRRLTMG